jgi:tape measure domain-containing protein
MSGGRDINIGLSFSSDASQANKSIAELTQRMDEFQRKVAVVGKRIEGEFQAGLGFDTWSQKFAQAAKRVQGDLSGLESSFKRFHQVTQGVGVGGTGVNAAIMFAGATQGAQNYANVVRNAFSGASTSFSQAFQAMHHSVQQLDLGLNQLDRTMKYLIGFGLFQLGSSFLQTAAALQRSVLEIAVFDSSFDKATSTIDEILKVTQQVPFSVKSMTDSFVKLKASGIDPIVGANGEGPLLNLANAVAAFGGTTDTFERAVLAISQMAGKGVISMEELRQQLGEALPTAIRSMAAGLDMPVSEFIYKVSQGQIEFERGFAALNSELAKQFGGVGQLMLTSMGGAFQAVKTQVEGFAVALNKVGAFDIITAGLLAVRDKIKQFTDYLDTAPGQDGLRKINDMMLRSIEVGDKMIPTFQRVGESLTNLASIAIDISKGFTGGDLAGGVLGLMIWGPKGALVGLLVGDDLTRAARLVTELGAATTGFFSKFNGDSSGALSAIGATVSDVAKMGALGFWLAGPTGALIGALGAIGLKVAEIIEKVASAPKGTPDYSQSDPLGNSTGGGAQAADAFNKANDAITNYNDKLKAAGASTKELKSVTTESGQTMVTVYEGTAQQIKMTADKFIEDRKRLSEAAAAQMRNYDPGVNEIKVVTEVSKALSSAMIQLKGDGDNWKVSQEKQRAEVEKLTPELLKAKGAIFQYSEELKKSKDSLSIADANGDTNGIREATRNVAVYTKNLSDAQKNYDGLTKLRSDYLQTIDGLEKIHQGKVDERSAADLANYKKIAEEKVRAAKEIEIKSGGGPNKSLELAHLNATADVDQKILAINKDLADLEKNQYMTEAQKLPVKNALLAAQKSLNDSAGKYVAIQDRIAKGEVEQRDLAVQKLTKQEEYNLSILKAKASFDTVAEAGLNAQHQIESQLDSIDQKIIQIQNQADQGLITQNSAQASISRLKQIKAEMGTVGAQVVEQQKFQASEAGKFWTDVGNSIESTLASSMDGLIKGTKKWKDVMMDFWSSITSAVTKYLAKEAMVKLFGEGGLGGSAASAASGGSGGGLLGSLFKIGGSLLSAGAGAGGIGAGLGGPIGLGGLFASGTDFIVGGAGATDSVPVNMRVSPGERVMVQTRNQQQREGGDAPVNIYISALDGASVQDVLMRNGDAIFGTMGKRTSLNRGFRGQF